MGAPHDSQKSVLVVEDDVFLRDLFKVFLEADGYLVDTAGDGREALERLRQAAPPSVVVLDLMMPRMDGWGFRAEQRKDPALAAIPVVICSAAGDPHAEAPELEAADYLQKPVVFEDLLGTVRRLAHLHGEEIGQEAHEPGEAICGV
jgi:two-component system response regulator MprA